jgi:hypothetical protein
LVTKPKSIKSLNASGTKSSVAEPRHSNTNAKNTRERYGCKNGQRLPKDDSFLAGDFDRGSSFLGAFLSVACMLIGSVKFVLLIVSLATENSLGSLRFGHLNHQDIHKVLSMFAGLIYT